MGAIQYKNGHPIPPSQALKKQDSHIIDRLLLRLINECIACLEEGVVEDDDLADAGMIFGTGFAPFRGGPIHYAKSYGIDALYQKLLQFQKIYGERFKPHSGWQKLISSHSEHHEESAIVIEKSNYFINAQNSRGESF